MSGIRHKARSAAVQVLTSLLLRSQVLTDDVESTIAVVKKEFFPQQKENDFFRDIVFGVIKNRKDIDPKIQKFAPKWPVSELPAIDRVILEISIYELLYTQTPSPIVINEAVELAKEFGDEGTPRFVNGVLSSVDKEKE